MTPEVSQLGAAGAVVIVVYFFLKFIREEGDRREKSFDRLAAVIEKTAEATDKNTVIAEKTAETVQLNTEATEALRTFMTRLNGSLKKTVEEKQAIKAADENQT
jgi:hypothetical protein